MNQDRMNSMQESYDNQCPEDDTEFMQTQEEIALEAEQELLYNKLMKDAVDMEWYATESFVQYLNVIEQGEAEEAGELLMFMLSQAADYNGSKATVPDFVRLVRMAFEWKSKQ